MLRLKLLFLFHLYNLYVKNFLTIFDKRKKNTLWVVEKNSDCFCRNQKIPIFVLPCISKWMGISVVSSLQPLQEHTLKQIFFT